MNSETNQSAVSQEENIWREVAPVLDEALSELGEKDRNAVLLRFFEQKNLAEVGHALGIGEDGARRRIERALDKLRGMLGSAGLSFHQRCSPPFLPRTPSRPYRFAYRSHDFRHRCNRSVREGSADFYGMVKN
jgi:hypothetical protein